MSPLWKLWWRNKCVWAGWEFLICTRTAVYNSLLCSASLLTCRIKPHKTFKDASMVFTSYYKEQSAAGFWSRKSSSEWNKHMKRGREKKLTVDVIKKDTMIFLELTELIFDKLQNFQAFKKSPRIGWAYIWSVCPTLCFPFLTDPFDDFPGKQI